MTVYSLGADAATNHVFTLRKDRAGRLWIGTAGGLFVLERPLRRAEFSSRRARSLDRHRPFRQVQALAEGPDGALWIGTLVRPLSAASRRTDRSRSHGPRLAEEIRQPARRSVRAGSGSATTTGSAWPFPRDFSIAGYVAVSRAGTPGLSWRFSLMPACPWRLAKPAGSRRSRGLPAIVRSLSEGADGRVWIGTRGGLIEFDGEGFRAYSERHGLPHETINAVAEDRAGNVWIGTDAGGVCQADEERLRQLQGGGRAQAQLRDVDFAESGRSSARRRRVAGAQRVRRRAIHLGQVQHSGTGGSGRVVRRARGPHRRLVGGHTGRRCFDSPRSPASRQLARTQAEGHLYGRERTASPPASPRRSRIPVATSG